MKKNIFKEFWDQFNLGKNLHLIKTADNAANFFYNKIFILLHKYLGRSQKFDSVKYRPKYFTKIDFNNCDLLLHSNLIVIVSMGRRMFSLGNFAKSWGRHPSISSKEKRRKKTFFLLFSSSATTKQNCYRMILSK